MPITIPLWVPPAARLNGQNELAATQLTLNAAGQPIPIAYGPCQIGARVFTRQYDGGYWTVGALFCVGEINRFVQIYLDNEVPGSQVDINTYVGSTSQGVDPLLEWAIGSDYTDTLVIDHPSGDIGIAYAVIRYPESLYPSPPSIIAEIEGKLVEDPDNPSGPLYSENGALHLRDLITSPHYGFGDAIDDDSVTATVAACAETVITEARRLTGIVLDAVQETAAWVETLQAYAGCWAHKRGDTWVLVPDRDNPSDPVRTLTKDDVLTGSLDAHLADPADVPTVVRIQYTDQSTTIWRDREAIAELAGVSNGTVPRRESFVRMPGVFRYSQAMREATERLQKLQRRLSISFVSFDDNIDLEVGDVFSFTHPYGFTGEYFRITEPPRLLRPGRVGIRAIEYDASDYDDSEDVPTWIDAGAVVGDDANLPEPGATSNTGALADLDEVDTAQIVDEAATAIATGSDAGTDIEFTTAQTVVSATINVGSTVDDQDIVAFFSCDSQVTYLNANIQGRLITVSIHDNSGAQVAAQTQINYNHVVQSAGYPLDYASRYISANQDLTSTSGVVVTWGTNLTVHYAPGSIGPAVSPPSYSAGEFTVETLQDWWLAGSIVIERSVGSTAGDVAITFEEWDGSSWIAITGAPTLRWGSAGTTGANKYGTVAFSFLWHATYGSGTTKFRVLATPSIYTAGTQVFRIVGGNIVLKDQWLYTNQGEGGGNLSMSFVIPTANIVAGNNTITVKAKLDNVTGIGTASLIDSNLVLLLRKK